MPAVIFFGCLDFGRKSYSGAASWLSYFIEAGTLGIKHVFRGPVFRVQEPEVTIHTFYLILIETFYGI
jgi:hypothetical protein